MPVTTAFWRNRLPHWEVREGVYFMTLRCADSLPASVVGQVVAIRDAIAAVPPNSKEFAGLVKDWREYELVRCFPAEQPSRAVSG